MASIEVSLSTTPRRKNGKKNGNAIICNMNKTSMFGGTSPANIFASIRSNTLIDTCRELEILRNALKDKENTIQNLQGQMNCCGRLATLQPLDPSERRTAELRLQSLKQEEDSRKSAIKKINLTLEQIDTNEANIDVRIKQAELEYELGREELGLLGVREEMRALQARLDAKPTPTLYSCVNSSGKYTLHCVQLEYDPKSPRFGAGNLEDKIGLFVLWATENSGLEKGDRILEVNGKLTLATTKEEMIRLLTVCPSKAEMVVIRQWSPPPSTEDFLRRENLRLTHRISYLEDQVSELLLLKEKPLLPNKVINNDNKDTEIFQKGSHTTLLQANTKSKNTSDPSLNANNCVEKHHEKFDNNKTVASSNNNFNNGMNGFNGIFGTSPKHEPDNYLSLQPKLYGTGEKIKSLTKKYEKDEFSSTLTRRKWKKDLEKEEDNRKRSSTKNSLLPDNSYSLSDLERPSKKSGLQYNRQLDYSSETSCSRYKVQRDISSVDGDEDDNQFKQKLDNTEYDGQHSHKPTPPKKPIRLSVAKASSLHSVDTGYSIQNVVRKMKRSHKGEAPQPPTFQDNKVNGNDNTQFVAFDSTSSHTSSRAESWKTSPDSGPPNFRWTGNYHPCKSKSEKWC